MHIKRYGCFCVAVLAFLVVSGVQSIARSDEGKTSYTTYYTVKSGSTLKLGEGRSHTITEFTGLTQNDAGEDMFNHMTARCVGIYSSESGVTEGQGGCIEVDKDGDEVFTDFTFTSSTKPPGGVHTLIGGTGKYSGISGEARFTVEYPKPPAEGMRMFIVPHEVTWKRP